MQCADILTKFTVDNAANSGTNVRNALLVVLSRS